MIKQTDATMKEFRSSNPSGEGSRDPSAFNSSYLVLLFTLLFVIIHYENYPDTPVNELMPLYGFILVAPNVPSFFASLRSYIVAPDTALTRTFVVLYDTFIFRGFFRNHLLLMLFAVAGFRWNQYFCLMLLDVVNNSPILKDILKAIKQPMPQLGVVGFTIFVTVVIFATFGLGYFHESIVFDEYDDEDEPVHCNSVVACIWLLVYKGVTAGELGDVLDGVDNTENGWLWRVLFDISFFIWVGIILFEVIAGLIIDTFGSLREEAGERQNMLDNECFVCGISRSAYDDLGDMNPTFDVHKDEDHVMWDYLYFVLYLRNKAKTAYTGVEDYVRLLVDSQNLRWIPKRTSLAIQNKKAMEFEKEDDIEAIVSSKLQEGLKPVLAVLGDLKAKAT